MRPEAFLNDARVAELWARFKEELAARQDGAAWDVATEAEVEEMLDETFGAPVTNETEENNHGNQ